MRDRLPDLADDSDDLSDEDAAPIFSTLTHAANETADLSGIQDTVPEPAPVAASAPEPEVSFSSRTTRTLSALDGTWCRPFGCNRKSPNNRSAEPLLFCTASDEWKTTSRFSSKHTLLSRQFCDWQTICDGVTRCSAAGAEVGAVIIKTSSAGRAATPSGVPILTRRRHRSKPHPSRVTALSQSSASICVPSAHDAWLSSASPIAAAIRSPSAASSARPL